MKYVITKILKNIKDFTLDLKDDFIFAEKVEKVWQEYDKNQFETKSKDDFLKELRTQTTTQQNTQTNQKQ